MQATDSPDTPITPSEPDKPVGAEHGPVSSKAAKLLGLNSSSGPTNKNKSGRHNSRRPKTTHSRPTRTDLEAGSRTIKDLADPAFTEQDAPGRTEEILQRLLSRRRNVVFCLIFLFSVVAAVAVVSGLQGKGNASGAAESPRSPSQIPQPSSTSTSNSSIAAPSSQIRDSAATPFTNTSVSPDISQVGVDGGQSAGSS